MMEKRSRPNFGSSTIHFLCKALVAMIILEGLVTDGPKGIRMFESVAASSVRQTQQPQVRDDGDDGRSINSNPYEGFNIARETTAKRLRDRCGRFSLLRVLQQWENLQKRCRLNFRDGYSNKEKRDRYEYMTSGNGPPSPLDIDDISIGKRSRHHFYSSLSYANSNDDDENRYRNNYYEVNGDALESCCPVVFEVIAPVYGRLARTGRMVELYKDENVQQKFYEYRCHKDYLEQPCRYVDSQHRKISKCVQQYLDTYALVRSENSATGWSMENIRIASGCACKVDPKKASRRRKKVSSQTQNSQRNYDIFTSLTRQRNKSKKRDFQKFRSSIIDY